MIVGNSESIKEILLLSSRRLQKVLTWNSNGPNHLFDILSFLNGEESFLRVK